MSKFADKHFVFTHLSNPLPVTLFEERSTINGILYFLLNSLCRYSACNKTPDLLSFQMKKNFRYSLMPCLLLVICCTLTVCASPEKETSRESNQPFLTVLGIAQDAGYPQAACSKTCCADVWSGKHPRKMVSCLALIDPESGQRWIFDATPDFKDQLRKLDEIEPVAKDAPGLDGIFLTHAHMGHYTGLMHLGREVIGAKNVAVHVMPRMKTYLTNNGPWQQLVNLENIKLAAMIADSAVQVNNQLRVTPFLVPHRDEYSETVGYRIDGPQKSALFIPDIDKWEKWARPIETMIAAVDVAYLDGTFFANGEIPGRDMAQIPHPFIQESIARFIQLPDSEKAKIVFIHLNHTNPALQQGSTARREIENAGFRVAEEGEIISL